MLRKPYVQLGIGFIALLFLGVAYAWSLFVAPLKSTFGWRDEMISMIFTISMICFCLGGILGSIIRSKYSHKSILIVMAMILTVGFTMCSKVQEIWQIYLAYGVICGLSIGISYNVIITTVNEWFEGHIGFSSGILTMGYGIGSFILGFFISKGNTIFGWRNTFQLLAIIFFLLIIAEAFLLKRPTQRVSKKRAHQSRLDYSPLEMMRSRMFYLFFLWGVIVSALGLAILGHVSQISVNDWNTLYGPVIATGFVSVSNGVSRIIYGHFYDKLGRATTMMMITTSLVTGIGILYLSILMQMSILMILGFILIGSSYGGLPPTNSAFVKQYFGDSHYGKNFSIATAGGVPAAFIGPYIMGGFVDRYGNYVYGLIFLLILAMVAVLFLVLLKINDNLNTQKVV